MSQATEVANMSARSSSSPSSDISPAAPSTASRHPCVACQRHKVKCDRSLPCSRCLTYGSECIQPLASRQPRRPARKSQDVHLDQRVRQLESSLEEMRTLLKLSAALHKNTPVEQLKERESPIIKKEEIDTALGHLILEDGNSRYVSTASWAKMVGEVSGLKTLLSENNGENDTDAGGAGGGRADLVTSLSPFSNSVPPDTCAHIGLDLLWQTYIKRVDPIMKIYHIPTIQPLITAALSGTQDLTPGTLCMLAAIKFAAVTSMTDAECWALGSSKESLLKVFRAECQCALKSANFLKAHSTITLEAFVIFLFCNRRHEPPRSMWILSGNAIRLAESLGIHRDGTLMKLPVFLTELRRRLWWQIRMLDAACAEDCGFSPSFIFGADTQLPLNINDADIGPQDTVAPRARVGFTEMTWSLVRFEISSKTDGYLRHKSSSDMFGKPCDYNVSECPTKQIQRCKEYLQTTYFQYCSQDIPLQRYTAQTGRLMLLKLELVTQYPLFQRQGNQVQVPQTLREKLAQTSFDVLETSHEMTEHPETYQYSWMLQTYIHWHPVAFLLHEICYSDQTPEYLARAWRDIRWTITDPHGLNEESNLALWKPLESLLSKASVKMREAGLHDNGLVTSPGGIDAESGFPGFVYQSNSRRTSDQVSSSVQSERSFQSQGQPPSIDSYFIQSDSTSVLQEDYFGPTSSTDFMADDPFQPFVTMDDFGMTHAQATFDQSWWNNNLRMGP